MPRLQRAFWVIPAFFLAACGSDGGTPVGPAPSAPPNLLGDAESGARLFAPNCAGCHTSRDGFDLALFGYTTFDLVRRGMAHVDSAQSRDIAAYVNSLAVAPLGRRTPVFQPEGPSVRDDVDFWVQLFGDQGWPNAMTPAALRAIDPRDVPVPLGFPLWSEEGSTEDWMPDAPLPSEILDLDGGVLRQDITAYYASPTEAHLVRALERFREASFGADRICWRIDPFPCFDARRWMSSLAAQHYLRDGTPETVPLAVAQVWWDVGESQIGLQAVARSAEARAEAFRSGARWMYLAFTFAPEAFDEPDHYMGTFLRSQGLDRLAVFATLRRMVGEGAAHRKNPEQFLVDGILAVRRSGGAIRPGVLEFVLAHHADRLETRPRPADLDLAAARLLLADTFNYARGITYAGSPMWKRLEALRDRALARLY